MQEILPAVEIADKVLKIQKRRNLFSRLRRMLFCVEQEIEDGILLYNVMTKQMILLGKDEEKEVKQKLFEKWFLVEDDFDDIKGSTELSSFSQFYRKKTKGLTGYTILPTTGCNARCFYCFEKGTKPIHMNADKALCVAKYIERTHVKGEKVNIHWFGGEPLMGIQAIDIISQYLRDNNIDYTSDMVSNGYLFTPSIIEKAKSLWNLKKVQITLDGTEDVYNKAKAYVYKLGSPYKRVINNIRSVAKAGIKVNIRLNIDLYNAEDLMALATELHNNLMGVDGVSVYSHVLFENEGEKRSEEDRELLYKKLHLLQKYLSEYGLFQDKYHRLERQIKLNHCMADNAETVLIAPDGSLGKCEHYADSNFFGHIDSEEQDIEMLKKFRKRLPAIDACKTCPIFPECIRLEVCAESHHCYPEEREQALDHIKRGMVAEYERWKEKQTTTAY